MADALIKVFSDFSTAQNAREQLLADGFPAGDVQLTALDDEAGPVEGNFMAGNGGAANNGLSGLLGFNGGTEETIYGEDFQNTVRRGSYVLTVETTDNARRAHAEQIMERFASADIRKS